jgi:hypothetical protein
VQVNEWKKFKAEPIDLNEDSVMVEIDVLLRDLNINMMEYILKNPI